MKHAPRSQQHHDFYAKYHHQDSKIRDLLGEYGFRDLAEKVFVIPEGPNDGWGETLVPSPGENADLPRPDLTIGQWGFEVVDGWLVKVHKDPVVVIAPDQGGSVYLEDNAMMSEGVGHSTEES